MKILSLVMLLSVAGIAFSQEANSKISIKESFDSVPVKNLWLKKNFSVDAKSGENGSGALFCEKTEPEVSAISTLSLKLSPNFKYRATVKYKAEGVCGVKGSRIFCIEFTNKKKYAGGSYFYKDVVEGKWTEVVLEFQPPAEFDSACAGFFLGKGATGKVWWDNFSIESVGPAVR